MKISVVTPCFNQVDTIERTIQSVLLQEFPFLEYIIVDGGSTDGTLDIINKYSSRINKIIVGQDSGQYNAINLGFSVASGDVFCWINGDDVLLSGSLRSVVAIFSSNASVDWISGSAAFIDDAGSLVKVLSAPLVHPRRLIASGRYDGVEFGFLQQENMFWRRELWSKVGGLDERLSLAADFNLWVRFSQFSDLVTVPVPFAAFCLRPGVQRSSVQRGRYILEVKQVKDALPSSLLNWCIHRMPVFFRVILRAFRFSRARCFHFSLEKNRWALLSIYGPCFRGGIFDSFFEFSARVFFRRHQ